MHLISIIKFPALPIWLWLWLAGNNLFSGRAVSDTSWECNYQTGLSNEADKTWEIDSHSWLVFSLRQGLRNRDTLSPILASAEYLTYSHGRVWSSLTPYRHFLSVGAAIPPHSTAPRGWEQPVSPGPSSSNYQFIKDFQFPSSDRAASKQRECFLIYVSNSVLSNWYLPAKFGQKGLLRLKIIFLTRSVNWSVSPVLYNVFSA